MKVEQLAQGLWRWSVAGRGSVYYEPGRAPADAIVLFDPIVPDEGSQDAERFWRALDRDAAGSGLPIAVLIAGPGHARGASRVQARYRDHGVTVQRVGGFRPGERLPGGVTAVEIGAVDGSEVAFWIDEHRTLVFADAVVGCGKGAVRRARDVSAAELRALVDLDPERLLTSHGEPVLEDGRLALAALLEAAEAEGS